MKVVRIIARLNVGGPAKHVVWATSGLTKDGFSSVLIAGHVPEGEEDMSYFAIERAVKPIYISELSRELSYKDIISLYKIYREIKDAKPDVIHTHTAKAGTVGRIAAFIYNWFRPSLLIGRRGHTKVVHTFHGHVFHSYYGKTKTWVFLMIEKVLARIATDRIVVISDQQLDEIHGKFGVGRHDQFKVIPLGIDLGEFVSYGQKRHLLRDEIGAVDDEVVVGYIGRLTEIKNLDFLLDIIAKYKRLANSAIPKLKFVLIGDGGLRERLSRRATELDIDDTVTFLGNRQNISDLLAGIDIVALTSKNEGTPLSLIEAMAAGKPVISTVVGGVADLLGASICEGRGFRVCERGVAVGLTIEDDFLEGLIYLAKDVELQRKIGDSGKVFVNKNYSLNRLTNDMVSLYCEMFNG